MPQLSAYVRDCIAEDMYSTDFYSQIDGRVEEMNTAQLQGYHDHLVKTINLSGFKTWGNANKIILQHVNKVLDERLKAQKIEENMEEYAEARVAHKEELERLKVVEGARVKKMMHINARTQAASEVKEKELKRIALERYSILQRVNEAEDTQKKVSAAALFGFIVVTIVAAVVLTNILFVCAAIVFALFVSVYICFRAYTRTQIMPIVVDPEEIDEQVDTRAEELITIAGELMIQKEKEYKIMQVKEKEERIKSKAIRREKLEFEKQLKEATRLEFLALAQGGAASVEGSVVGSDDGLEDGDDVADIEKGLGKRVGSPSVSDTDEGVTTSRTSYGDEREREPGPEVASVDEVEARVNRKGDDWV